MPKAIDLSKFPLSRRFAILTRLYYGALTKRLEHLDIERYFSVLILIATSEKKCSQQYISDVMKKDKTSMVRIIDYLTDKGYIKREQNPNDRREYHLKLTKKAEKEIGEIHKTINGLNRTATKGLSAKQLESFYKSINIISSNLMNEPGYKVIMHVKKAKNISK